ncbi:Putative agmatinase 2 [Fulvia fulva]|uniref:Agmatinase 2 n=1 Tax=Passalora fulva TaxID=5499 RepID=A0A9Q8L565_PASFU|nr:Putative agmatinase 2 [Fulvia fulva]KAK4634152.1 putative agmatinase 2 [Fulvia fulva]KAK4636950.1 putative agmatinase 2 [Fulvia fulva]UJO10992.1 Putative agmatinase 2 [Fulvia fulva]WPV09805.1 Putative agmatinase 2 [Fulvia fulva]WPV23922.1 Putative agmatinase 2 [Fulvia fulva]
MLAFSGMLAFPALLCHARDITFPPISGMQTPLTGNGANNRDLDLSQIMFAGLTTYANLPYVHCLAADEEHVEPYDIAILGAPFDTGVTARPGARFGPNGIRQGSQ